MNNHIYYLIKVAIQYILATIKNVYIYIFSFKYISSLSSIF